MNRILDEELLAEIQRLHDELGHVPKVVEMEEYGAYSYGVYYKRFGGWEASISKAGFKTDQIPRKTGWIPEKELLAEIQRLHNKLDRVPKTLDMIEHGEYSDVTYRNRFGSWDEAITQAGFDPADIPRVSRIPDEELLADLRDLAEEIDRIPRQIDMFTYGTHAPNTYRVRFGSWPDALEKAGIK
ncbi:hypothetical protein SAMN06264855_10312 [Halorubrum vacuolatum]|uniref:Uncharacterized protein n=2 Tax=Halorubrum vacuolatum TaxID=63740 RepID=A0A238VJD7_HALVU|nr:hypothetical protein SAMN06264855_10312 [Halorubrum vacuolatum]